MVRASYFFTPVPTNLAIILAKRVTFVVARLIWIG